MKVVVSRKAVTTAKKLNQRTDGTWMLHGGEARNDGATQVKCIQSNCVGDLNRRRMRGRIVSTWKFLPIKVAVRLLVFVPPPP